VGLAWAFVWGGDAGGSAGGGGEVGRAGGRVRLGGSRVEGPAGVVRFCRRRKRTVGCRVRFVEWVDWSRTFVDERLGGGELGILGV